MILEITLPGFNGGTGETDHLVKWISAVDSSEVDRILTRTGLATSASPVGGIINNSDIDYWLPRDAERLESDILRMNHD